MRDVLNHTVIVITEICYTTVATWSSHRRRRRSNDAVVDPDVVQLGVAASGIITHDVAPTRQWHRVFDDDVVAATSRSCDETSATYRQTKVRKLYLLLMAQW